MAIGLAHFSIPSSCHGALDDTIRTFAAVAIDEEEHRNRRYTGSKRRSAGRELASYDRPLGAHAVRSPADGDLEAGSFEHR